MNLVTEDRHKSPKVGRFVSPLPKVGMVNRVLLELSGSYDVRACTGSHSDGGPLGPLSFECSQHGQTLRPTVDGTRSKALPIGAIGALMNRVLQPCPLVVRRLNVWMGTAAGADELLEVPYR